MICAFNAITPNQDDFDDIINNHFEKFRLIYQGLKGDNGVEMSSLKLKMLTDDNVDVATEDMGPTTNDIIDSLDNAVKYIENQTGNKLTVDVKDTGNGLHISVKMQEPGEEERY